MKSLLLSLALCAALAGCASYVPAPPVSYAAPPVQVYDPATGTYRWIDPATGMPTQPAYAYPYYAYPYGYAPYAYVPYAYDAFWFSGSFFCCGGRHHFRGDHFHGHGGAGHGGRMHGGRR